MTIKNASKTFEKNYGPFTFAMFILGCRTTLNLTQVQLATKLGISKAALCEIEKGRTLVSVNTAVRYAKKMGFSTTVAIEACLQDQLNKANVKKRIRLEESA